MWLRLFVIICLMLLNKALVEINDGYSCAEVSRLKVIQKLKWSPFLKWGAVLSAVVYRRWIWIVLQMNLVMWPWLQPTNKGFRLNPELGWSFMLSILGSPVSSQQHDGRWIDYIKLPLVVNACMCIVSSIGLVFHPHAQSSQDRLQIHCGLARYSLYEHVQWRMSRGQDRTVNNTVARVAIFTPNWQREKYFSHRLVLKQIIRIKFNTFQQSKGKVYVQTVCFWGSEPFLLQDILHRYTVSCHSDVVCQTKASKKEDCMLLTLSFLI